MIIDKPDVVYVMENQSVSITITLNHVNATVIWKRQVTLRTHITVQSDYRIKNQLKCPSFVY